MWKSSGHYKHSGLIKIIMEEGEIRKILERALNTSFRSFLINFKGKGETLMAFSPKKQKL